MRILGLDYGSKTVGVALSDPLLLTASALEIIRRPKENHLRKTFARIGELIGQYDVTSIVLGDPIHMDGTAGERSKAAHEFGAQLKERFGLPVFLWDERLTSVEAEEILREAGLTKEEQKEHVDALAAQILLTDFLREREHGKTDLSCS